MDKRYQRYILYEDKDILVCHKPAGLAVQNARVGSMDMESLLKNYIAQKVPGKMPYLGIIHRWISRWRAFWYSPGILRQPGI